MHSIDSHRHYLWKIQTFGRKKHLQLTCSGATDKLNRKPMGNGSQISSGRWTLASQTTKNGSVCGAVSTTWNRQNSLEFKTNLFKHVKSYLSEGDLNSAYAEALCTGDEILLIELIDRTGPVLESLSHKTASDVLSTLASYILEKRFINSIIPWLRQASTLLCLSYYCLICS